MTGPVTVTQADREHYAAILKEAGAPDWTCQDARDGVDDDDYAMGLIARFRLAAEERGARMALEAAAKVAETTEGFGLSAPFVRVACDYVADAIRQTDPAQIVKGQPNDR